MAIPNMTTMTMAMAKCRAGLTTPVKLLRVIATAEETMPRFATAPDADRRDVRASLTAPTLRKRAPHCLSAAVA